MGSVLNVIGIHNGRQLHRFIKREKDKKTKELKKVQNASSADRRHRKKKLLNLEKCPTGPHLKSRTKTVL